MKSLEEIRPFPAKHRRALESRFGIESAEAFFANALADPAGMAEALGIEIDETARLAAMVEGYLPAGYRARCEKPVKRARGLNLD